MDKTENMTFGDMLKRLDEIANILDTGDASLEQSLELFEEASGLIKLCNAKIKNAHLKITDISRANEANDNE